MQKTAFLQNKTLISFIFLFAAATSRLADVIEIDLDELRRKRTPLCRECLDWSERRSHLAGSLGRAFLSRFEKLSWARRDPKTRIVTFSRTGAKEFERLLGGG